MGSGEVYGQVISSGRKGVICEEEEEDEDD
jgi:hypothetical protein